MSVDITNLRNKNGVKAIIRSIELMGLKNPDKITKVDELVYSHTSTRGRVRYFRVTKGIDDYLKNFKNEKHKLHRVNGFYIVESDDAL